MDVKDAIMLQLQEHEPNAPTAYVKLTISEELKRRRQEANDILKECGELSRQTRYSRINSDANCMAILGIYNMFGIKGIREWLDMTSKNYSSKQNKL